MPKWLVFVLGVAGGAILAPKIRSLVKLPSIG